MRLFAYLFFTALLMQWFFPWWSFVPLCLLAGYAMAQSGGQAFGIGFLAIGLSWWLPAAFFWFTTHSLLADRLATLLGLPGGALVLLIAGLLSGLLGGLATVTGWWVRRVGAPPRSRYA